MFGGQTYRMHRLVCQESSSKAKETTARCINLLDLGQDVGQLGSIPRACSLLQRIVFKVHSVKLSQMSQLVAHLVE